MLRKILFSLLAGLLLLTGCALTEEEILPQIERKLGQLDSYYAQLEVVVYSFEGEQVYQVKQWQEFPDRWRVEVQTHDEVQYFICDGKQIWLYQPGIDDYYRLDLTRNPGELAPPFMLSGYLNQLLAADNFNFGGEKELHGEPFYVVSYGGQMQGETVKLWLDKKTLFPLVVETFLDDKPLNRLQVKILEMNPKIEASLFEFKAAAEQQAASHCQYEQLTLEEAKKGWPVPVYVPSSLPEGSFLYVISRVPEAEREQLIFVYQGSKPFTLVQYPAAEKKEFAAEYAQKLHFAGREGFYWQNKSNDLATLCWSNGQSDFILTGSLPAEEMTAIASSLQPAP
ncbi:MAG: DUF4367 domain-containing protein [Firmicutes bacterium]|nr:DUF4367 domain-containing protein [Bacillota bacterium]